MQNQKISFTNANVRAQFDSSSRAEKNYQVLDDLPVDIFKVSHGKNMWTTLNPSRWGHPHFVTFQDSYRPKDELWDRWKNIDFALFN